MNTIFVIATGDSLCRTSEESIRAASERWDCNLMQVDEVPEVTLHPACWKLLAQNNNTDRVLILDADTVVNSACPDPFKVFPEDKLTVVTDRQVSNGARDKAELDEWEIVTGDRTSPSEYFNTGMIMTCSDHHPLFVNALDLCYSFPSLAWHDQTPLNVVMSFNPDLLNFVDPTWNFHNPNLRLSEWRVMSKNIYHFPGNPDRLTLIPQVQWK